MLYAIKDLIPYLTIVMAYSSAISYRYVLVEWLSTANIMASIDLKYLSSNNVLSAVTLVSKIFILTWGLSNFALFSET